jgi:hypothetical protein
VIRLRVERPGFDSQQGQGFFQFITTSRPALGSTQPPIQWVPGALSPGVKWPKNKDDFSSPSSAEVNNAWSHISNPNTSSWRVA